jgi:hypothetical protein
MVMPPKDSVLGASLADAAEAHSDYEAVAKAARRTTRAETATSQSRLHD